MSPLVWLITGTSSGIGFDLTLAALKRGDKVIATARAQSLRNLEPLKKAGAETVELDVVAEQATLDQIAKKAVEMYGRIDVLVNNAGYIHVGALEELTQKEQVDQFNTNVFGALNVTKAVLPYMRKEKKGTIMFLGSIGGWHGIPEVGIYIGTKYAIRGISESLHAEIAPLGLRSTCIELGYFRTNLLTPGKRTPYVPRIDDYKAMSQQMNDFLEQVNLKQPGDPKKAVEVMVDVAHGEGMAKDKEFPTVVALGSDCYEKVKSASEITLKRIEEWKDVAVWCDLPKGV